MQPQGSQEKGGRAEQEKEEKEKEKEPSQLHRRLRIRKVEGGLEMLL